MWQTTVAFIVDLLQWPYRWLRYGSPVKADETVVLFPQSASVNAVGGWHIPLHAWVVELEAESASRRIAHHLMIELFQQAKVINEEKNNPVFRRRLNWFLADREVNKRLTLQIDDQTYRSPRSPPSGHIKYSVQHKTTAPAGSFIEYRLAQAGGRTVAGLIQLVPEKGLSVISDIDDTIKISNVTNKRQLVRGIFFDEYKVAAGMPDFYSRLAARDVCFHYVSSSPWQLYPTLAPMLKQHYPTGSVTLRHFYIASRSFIDFFRHSMQYKLNTVTDLLNRFPGRDFILIGDSGEKDPEIYSQIAGLYGARVRGIFIRQVQPVNNPEIEKVRWQTLRSSLPDPEILKVFTDPAELYRFADSITNESGTAT